MNQSSSTLFSFLGAAECLPPEREVGSIQIDSRRCTSGSLFLALKGSDDNGAHYIGQAFEKGAVYAVTDDVHVKKNNVLVVPDLREKLVPFLNFAYGNPLENLLCIAVTGTNGKTTVATLITAILNAHGHKAMNFGTIQNQIGDKIVPATLTTPNPVQLFDMLKIGVEEGCTALIMEASSHALSQHRVGRMFHRAVFTNLTQDHLDYHKTFENYFEAKKRLFTHCLLPGGVAVVNTGNNYGRQLANALSGKVMTYQSEEMPEQYADVTLSDHRLMASGTITRVNTKSGSFEATASLVGKINLENLAAAYATGISLDLSHRLLSTALRNVCVPGRNEKIEVGDQALAVIDYAHTPDALERVLKSFRPMVKGALCCVFGCGGDRDVGKRPLMGNIAERNADKVIITNDNPRTENPVQIVAQIEAGIQGKKHVQTILDRRAAIESALNSLGVGDCVIIAGKGHEDYQEIGTQRFHFSDREVVAHWARHRQKGGRVG